MPRSCCRTASNTRAEIGSVSSKTSGPVLVSTKDTYGQFARLHLNNHGVVRA